MRPAVRLQPKRGSNFPLSPCVILSTSAIMASLGGLHVMPSISVNCVRSPLFLLPHQKWGLRCIDIQQRLLWTLVNNTGRILERALMNEEEGVWPGKTSSRRPLKEMLISGPVSFFFSPRCCSSLLACLSPLVHSVLQRDPPRQRQIAEACCGGTSLPIPAVLDALASLNVYSHFRGCT